MQLARGEGGLVVRNMGCAGVRDIWECGKEIAVTLQGDWYTITFILEGQSFCGTSTRE